jgi:hypothetical protein
MDLQALFNGQVAVVFICVQYLWHILIILTIASGIFRIYLYSLLRKMEYGTFRGQTTFKSTKSLQYGEGFSLMKLLRVSEEDSVKYFYSNRYVVSCIQRQY